MSAPSAHPPAGALPPRTEPVIRPDDGEHVGYVAPSGQEWLPLNLVGFPLGEAISRDSAERMVIAVGLASLDGAWWCRAPKPFPSDEAELRQPEPDWPWRKVLIVEVSASACVIRPALAWPEEASVAVRLTLPVGDVLRSTPSD